MKAVSATVFGSDVMGDADRAAPITTPLARFEGNNMRHRMKRSVLAAIVGIASLGVLGGTAVADPEAAGSWYTRYDSWNDPQDKGGVSIFEGAYKDVGGGKTEYVKGDFRAYGETVRIADYHKNGRPAIVKLWVGGSGPAVFYAEEDWSEREIPGSYDEGQTVYLQVCTSDSPNAVCSPKKAKGRT
jgi:hypothetical protein